MFRWLWVFVIAIGCGGRARVHKPDEIWLKSIRIEGNHSIEEDDLIPGLALDRMRRDGDRVDPYQLGQDTRRIRSEYMRMGFFDAKVEGKIERDERQKNAEIVVFTVEEGPRYTARVAVTDLPPELTEEAVLAKLELKDGAPFEYELYDDDKDVVKAMVEEVGYPRVDLLESVVTVDRATRVAAVSYRVVLSGPRAVFGKVIVKGLTQFPDLELAIMGRVAFREGELFSPRAIAETSRSLYDLGRFSQVRILPVLVVKQKPGGEVEGDAEADAPSKDTEQAPPTEVVPIVIEVTVAGRHEIKGGGGFGYEPATYETRLRGGFSYIPEEFPLLSLGFDGRLALSVDHGFEDFEPRLRLFFNVQRLELFRPYVVGDFGAGLEYFTLESYTARGPILRTGLTAPLGKRWLTGQLAWNFSYFEFFDVSDLISPREQAVLGFRDNERNGRFEQSIAADLRDKPLEPRRGIYVGLRVVEGGAFAGGAFNYLEIQPDLRAYLPIRTRSSLAFRVRGGVFFGDVPVTQRYFSGGAQNHRGFSARALAPRIEGLGVDGDGNPVVESTPIGGEVFLETGAELRLSIGELSGVLFGTTMFVDAGDVVQQEDGLDLQNLHVAGGMGMFVKFGGFKIRIDVGHRLTRRAPDGILENTTLFLGVGETY